MEQTDKVSRVLRIYSKLMNGSIVNKTDEANYYGVNERTIQRDIDDIRDFLDQENVEEGYYNSVVYDRIEKGYRLQQIYNMKFTNPEILLICKILLDSRAVTKNEMQCMLDKLLDACVPEKNQKLVKDLISNEKFHYIEPKHGQIYIDKLWELGKAIHEHRLVEIQYRGIQGTTVKTRRLKPLALMFSEYYFYLTAFIDDEEIRNNFNVINDAYPTIYRVDRIQGLTVLNEHFAIPYTDRFEEGEFRKRIQFMYGGKLRRIKFEYTGYTEEAILDRLPTATVIDKKPQGDGKKTMYTMTAEVFGDGIDMWLKSQGENIKLL